MPVSSTLATATAVANERRRQRINEGLAGPVMVLMIRLVPDLAVLPRGREFEAVLGDWQSLHRCFQAFRAHRDQFRPLLRDRWHVPVDNDNTPLECGRTVNQVVAMIVRSAAKRHFRQRLNPPNLWTGRPGSRFDKPEDLGWSGMTQWLIGRTQAHRQARRAPEVSPADRLYAAIHHYLLHDWQVPIIPQYARLTPLEARALGSRLLDFRDSEQLAAWLDGGADYSRLPSGEPEAPPVPVEAAVPPSPEPESEPESEFQQEAVVGGASLPGSPLVDERSRIGAVLSLDGRLIRMEAMVPILVRPEIKDILGRPGLDEMRRASRALATTGAGTVRRLAVDFGLPPEQMAVMLAKSALLLPPAVFERLFGRKSELVVIMALIEKAKRAGLGPDSSPAAFAAFVDNLFGRFVR